MAATDDKNSAFDKAQVTFNSVKRLVNSWIPSNAPIQANDL